MEAVILSGGLGTRLRPLTYTRPKPLLPIANRPMLAHLLDRMPEPVDRAILAAGYRVDQIRAWADGLEHRVDLTVVAEDTPLGTAGAVKNVADEIHGDFLCLNGDVLSTAPLDTMIETRRDEDALATIALWEVDDPSPFGVVDLDGRRITRFVEKPDPGAAPSNLINAGAYCFDERVLDRIEEDRKVSLEHETFPAVIDDGETLVGVPFEGHWIDSGQPDVYLEAHELLLDDEVALADGARLEGDWSGWAALGREAAVEAGARIDRSVLFDGVAVETGATVTRSILGEGVRVGKDAQVSRCVVGDGEHVEPGATHEDQALGVDPDRPVGGEA